MKRCDYCERPAAITASYTGYISRRGPGNPRNHVRIVIGACHEHEGCPNWTGMLRLHPEAIIQPTNA